MSRLLFLPFPPQNNEQQDCKREVSTHTARHGCVCVCVSFVGVPPKSLFCSFWLPFKPLPKTR